MTWWEIVIDRLEEGDTLLTPGRGLDGGNKRRPFTILSIEANKIEIKTGKSIVVLSRACFDLIENTFKEQPEKHLRVASLKSNEPLENSADQIIRAGTGSNLARGNYVCAILEKTGLVEYAMKGNQKNIILTQNLNGR